MTITTARVDAAAVHTRHSTETALLRHALHAARAMRSSSGADQVLGLLTATTELLVPAECVWAARRPARGGRLTQSLVVGTAAPPVVDADVVTFLDHWSAQLAESSPPFEVAIHETPFEPPSAPTHHAATAVVFPLTSASGDGALVVATPGEPLSTAQMSTITMLCTSASMALDVERAQAAAAHADALNSALTQLTVSYADADAVLQTVVRSTAKLLGTDAAFVMLADATKQKLTVKTAYGITSKRFFNAVCTTDDELLPAAAIRTRRVVCVRDLNEFEQSKHSKPEGLRSAMCAPMFIEDELVGVLLAAHRCLHEPSEDDRHFIAALANAAAISIGNARLYADREQSIGRLSDVNRLLEQRSAALERVVAFQRQVTTLVLDGRGLAEIAGALSDALGRASIVMDRDLSLVTPAGPSDLPEGVEISALREAVGVAMESVCERDLRRVSVRGAGQDVPVVVAPLELGTEVMAYVVVVEGSVRLDSTDVGIATSGVTAIGLELMRDRASAEAEARLTGGLFQMLLSGEDLEEATVTRRASYLGYRLTGANVAVALRHANAKPGDAIKLEACVRRAMRRLDNPIAVFERDDSVFVVLSDPDDITPKIIDRHCALIREELAIAGRNEDVCLAIAGPHRGLAGVKQAVTEAAHALHVQGLLGRSGSVSFEELGVWALLGRIGDRDHLTGFAAAVLGPLVEHDNEHNAELVDTLRELAARNYHYRTAAEALFAHPNTLRYRMARIAELTGIDFADADDRLRVELALRIRDLLGPHTAQTSLQ